MYNIGYIVEWDAYPCQPLIQFYRARWVRNASVFSPVFIWDWGILLEFKLLMHVDEIWSSDVTLETPMYRTKFRACCLIGIRNSETSSASLY